MTLLNITTPGLGLIFWQIILFALIFFVLAKFAWKPILGGLKEREDDISNALKAADAAKLEMASLKSTNEAMMAQARIDRDAIMAQATATANEFIATAKANAATEANKMLESARAVIVSEKNKALAEVKNITANLSVDIAEKILKNQLADKAAQEKLVGEYLKEAKLN